MTLVKVITVRNSSPESIGLGFRVWEVPRGQVGGVKLVLRTFPKLVGRSAQNLVEIGPAV